MLGHSPFYHKLLRKYTTTFGTLFNDISIIRSDDNPDDTLTIKVPLTYSVKEKVLARFNQDPNIDNPSAITLPRMSFELLGMNYDSARKTPSIERVSYIDPNNPENKRYQYAPTPWNFDFRLSIYIKNTEDGLKIVEQILPFFKPDYTVSAFLVEEMGIKVDLPIILNSVNMEDQYEGDFKERKVFIWTLNFVLKGFLYGPVSTSGVIKYSNTTIYTTTSGIDNIPSPIGNTSFGAKILITPGLTSNNQPTTNSAESISPLLINIDDDFGYCVDITETSS